MVATRRGRGDSGGNDGARARPALHGQSIVSRTAVALIPSTPPHREACRAECRTAGSGPCHPINDEYDNENCAAGGGGPRPPLLRAAFSAWPYRAATIVLASWVCCAVRLLPGATIGTPAVGPAENEYSPCVLGLKTGGRALVSRSVVGAWVYSLLGRFPAGVRGTKGCAGG